MNERLTVRVPSPLAHQLAALATRRGVAVSDIVRDALLAYCNAPPQHAPSPAPPASAPAPRPPHPPACPCIHCRQVRRAVQARTARPGG